MPEPLKTRVWDQLKRAAGQKRGLSRLIRNLWIDLRFGGRFLGGHIVQETAFRDYWGTANTDYDVLTRMFSEISVHPEDVFVDVGCGKGRTFNWFLHRGFTNRLVGLEIVPEIAEFTRSRLRRHKRVEIVTGDVRELLPEGSIYYLFNPFGADTMRVFAGILQDRAVKNSPKTPGRPVILYARCDHLDVFRENPFWSVKEVDLRDLGFLRGAVIQPATPARSLS